MIVSMIAAVAENRVIGFQGKMPWHLPNDLKYFKVTTLGHHIIMGRKTFVSFARKKPLPKRTNIIITRNPDYHVQGTISVGSIEAALQLCRKNGETEAFIIGGAQIYKDALRLADKLYITRINKSFEGDTFFPEIDSLWVKVSTIINEPDERNQYEHHFEVYMKER